MKNAKKIISTLIAATLIAGATLVTGGVTAKAGTETGVVSWYRGKTSNGAAHKTLPFGTRVNVTNLKNNKRTTVVINDRGPFVAGRILDMSKASFARVEKTSAGLFNGKITW